LFKLKQSPHKTLTVSRFVQRKIKIYSTDLTDSQ